MSGVAPGWEGSGTVHRPLVPHPWDEVASRIYPGAQTVPEAEAILEKKRIDDLVNEVSFGRSQARHYLDDAADADEEADRSRDKLVALIGEDAAKDALGADWETALFG